MNRPAILKKLERWHGEDRKVFVTGETGKMYFVEFDKGCFWVFKDRIEFTDQQEMDL